ncbi:MAG: DUF3417 domain-containing protein, partial [Acidobacteria bacterium]|nr:DUF3417 domain-containing protein [Acidobacteriota bacterium]
MKQSILSFMKEFDQKELSEFESIESGSTVPAPYAAPPASQRLIEPLAALNDLSMNFYWSWHPEGSELFRELDPSLWEKYEQNPR